MTAPEFHVFLSHGLESGPGSTKIQAMKDVADAFPGVTATAIDHRSSRDPEVRFRQMAEAMSEAGAVPARTILAGSSMGGWVCAHTSSQTPVLGCFLLAPALALPQYPQSSPRIQATFTQIILGWEDDVIPVMPVLELARDQRLPVLVLPDGHRLENSVERVASEFRSFLGKCLAV
ncbi:YqiA/YcfP family alpha/beta fold hydrolase [Marinobacter sp. chi1]|uniref:YqiA/YcfP family alpha/beta fold hydrolase n=1 Tax=Marinobacter suaedae TaxID=3057675 RepID=A0ABT8W066_9GAMM|nr:YqiA/YcfP family alpha/beta fold hydrolase [Marinobacter sp. chi1]MDO3721612.1 YqiA/YcfP family alpha/beta fold hydrolase [Marinobacter sp. chi1]